jgi:hypothetical protein
LPEHVPVGRIGGAAVGVVVDPAPDAPSEPAGGAVEQGLLQQLAEAGQREAAALEKDGLELEGGRLQGGILDDQRRRVAGGWYGGRCHGGLRGAC